MMPADKSKIYDFTVSEQESGTRLDVFLASRNVSVSRSQVKRIIDEGLVTVNGAEAKAGYKLRQGDVISFRQEEAAGYDIMPEAIPLKILYEDSSILVVDKPAGMVTHPSPGHYSGTLVNALLHHCKDLAGIGGVLRPGIVHRLDKDTSGLLVAVKTEEALNGLARQFKGRTIRKVYETLVHGDMEGDEGVIDLPIGRHPVHRKKMSTSSRRGKNAVTRWKVLERYGIISYLQVEIETGRTHQIRVHLNSSGHPVLGDNVYGTSARRINNISDNAVRSRLKMMKRQALHASRIGFDHPGDGRHLEFSSPLPEDMASIRDYLRTLAGC
ncbi:MAG: RluA family pseudouridine synthase [Syntrophales bacterium]